MITHTRGDRKIIWEAINRYNEWVDIVILKCAIFCVQSELILLYRAIRIDMADRSILSDTRIQDQQFYKFYTFFILIVIAIGVRRISEASDRRCLHPSLCLLHGPNKKRRKKGWLCGVSKVLKNVSSNVYGFFVCFSVSFSPNAFTLPQIADSKLCHVHIYVALHNSIRDI